MFTQEIYGVLNATLNATPTVATIKESLYTWSLRP